MTYAAHMEDWHRPLWLALLVTSFIWCWPVGLALLAFTIGSKRMGCWNHEAREAWRQARRERFARWCEARHSSGNRAFDAYRRETLERLQEEQREFGEFLDRLRFARDKAEFESFLAERRAKRENPEPPPATA